MNARQERFCHEYAASGNATKAAEAAGYSPRTARSQGQRLLTNADIKALIREISQTLKQEKIASITDIQAFWSELMQDGSQKATDRIKAAELLMRSKGGFLPSASPEDTGEDIVLIYVPDNGLGGEGGGSNGE